MTNQRRDDESNGVRRWVKLIGIVIAVLILLAVVLMLVGGGGHGPGRHMQGASTMAAVPLTSGGLG